MEDSKMKKHVTAVGAIQIAVSSIGLIISMGAFILLSNLLDFLPTNEMPGFVVKLLEYLFKVFPVFLGILSLLGVIGGIALLSYKSWGRILVIIVAAFGCLNIPIGTLIGVYTIWVLMQDETVKLFLKQ